MQQDLGREAISFISSTDIGRKKKTQNKKETKKQKTILQAHKAFT